MNFIILCRDDNYDEVIVQMILIYFIEQGLGTSSEPKSALSFL